MINEYFKIALKNIRKRRLRSWLTMIGIVISIATIFVLISISIGLKLAIAEQFRSLGTDKFFVFPRGTLAGPGTAGAVQLTTKDVDILEKVRGVKAVTYINAQSAEIEYDDQKRYVYGIGIPLDRLEVFEEINSFKIDEGRFLEKGDRGKVMIGSQYKYNEFFKKQIRTGDKITINGQIFKVQAVLQSIGNPQDDRQIYMSFDDFKELYNVGDRVDQIVVQISQGENIKAVAETAERKLRTFREVTEKTKDFDILTPEELLSSFNTILNIITAFLGGVAAISLIVGAIGIMNTMYTSVLERTKDIGVMKAVGAKNSDILQLFLIESGLLGFVGGLLGVAFGYGAAKLIEYVVVVKLATTLLRAAAPVYLLLGCLAFSFIIGALSGIWPAWRASRIKVVDALRYE